MSAAPLRANGSAFLLVAYPMLVALRQVAEARGPPQRGEFERGPHEISQSSAVHGHCASEDSQCGKMDGTAS